jgi:aminomethyltransferase
MRRQAVTTLLQALGRVGSEATAKHSNSTAALGLFATRGYADLSSLKKTVLYDYHVANGGA